MFFAETTGSIIPACQKEQNVLISLYVLIHFSSEQNVQILLHRLCR